MTRVREAGKTRGYDPVGKTLIPHMGLQETMRAALVEYGQNLRFPHPDGMVEDPDGEMVQLWDQDAGF